MAWVRLLHLPGANAPMAPLQQVGHQADDLGSVSSSLVEHAVDICTDRRSKVCA